MPVGTWPLAVCRMMVSLMSLMLASVLVTTGAVQPVSPFDSSSSLSFVAPGHFSSSNT